MCNSDIRISGSGSASALRPRMFFLIFTLFTVFFALHAFAAGSPAAPLSHGLRATLHGGGNNSTLEADDNDRAGARDAIRFNAVQIPPCPVLAQNQGSRIASFKLPFTPFRFCIATATITATITRAGSSGARLAIFHFQNVLRRALPVRAGPRF